MDILMLTLVFIFGTIIGSFLNVVIYRYNSGTSPLKGRSQCFACGKTLTWRELVPVFSFLLQKGRCSVCRTKLSWQYPAVEALTGIMFVAVFLLGKPALETVYLLSIFSALIVIAVYDLRHQIIPDGLAVFFAIASISWFIWSTPASFERLLHFPYHWTFIAGPMLFAPFWALWFVSRGRWIGLGDGKLAWGIGWFLGATLGGSAVMLGFWVGAAYALAIMGMQRIPIIASAYASQKSQVKKLKVNAPASVSMVNGQWSNVPLSMQSEIPFGPFLILGTIIVYFTRVNFFDGSINLLFFL